MLLLTASAAKRRRRKNEFDHAIDDSNEAIRLDPTCAAAYCARGMGWKGKQEFDRAMNDFTAAMRLDPNDAYAYNAAAWLMATWSQSHCRNGEKAIELATKACALHGGQDAASYGTLAAAYAEAGDFDAAARYQKQAVELNSDDAELLGRRKQRLALYEQRKPVRQ